MLQCYYLAVKDTPTYAPMPALAYAPAPAPAYAPAQSIVQFPASAAPLAGAPGHGLRVTGIVCGATGLAALVAGGFFSLETEDYSHTVQKADVFQPSLDDRGKLYQTLQWVGYGVGAGLVATGAVLYAIGASSAKASSLALAPALLPGGAGFSAQGAF